MKVPYQEKQRFSLWWLWLILLCLLLIPFYGIYQQMVLGEPFGNHPMPDTGLLIFAVFMVAFLGFIYLMKLTLIIDQDGLSVHFFPLFKRKVEWREIEHLQVVNYGFVGGYGIRITHRFGTVYNMSGKWGLLVYLKSGKRFCVGTRNKEALQQFLKDIDLKVS